MLILVLFIIVCVLLLVDVYIGTIYNCLCTASCWCLLVLFIVLRVLILFLCLYMFIHCLLPLFTYRAFIGMTAHWIVLGNEGQMERQSAGLVCRRIDGRHGHKFLTKLVHWTHRVFEIESKVCMTTMDNASNFVKAFRVELISELEFKVEAVRLACSVFCSHVLLSASSSRGLLGSDIVKCCPQFRTP